MRSLVLRGLLVLVALAAVGGAGYHVWTLEERLARERSDADSFSSQAYLAVTRLVSLAAAQRGYVADGQMSDQWQARVASMLSEADPLLAGLRKAARSPEAQGALETAVETWAAFGRSDVKARDYIKSNQRLSASDVIFADGQEQLSAVTAAIDQARGQESVARATAIEKIRLQQLTSAGVGVAIVTIMLLLLSPIPRGARTDAGGEFPLVADLPTSGSFGLSRIPASQAPKPAAAPEPAAEVVTRVASRVTEPPRAPAEPEPDLAATAEICSLLAQVEDPRELPGLLDRAAQVLNASGLIVWMPEGPQGQLRPVLAHGYAPLALTRMGLLQPDADNATAVAYRTHTLQTISAEPLSNGAIVAPLITSDGCTGAIAIEFNPGAEPTPIRCSVATILAAQLATLITPAPPVEQPPAPGTQAKP